MPSQTSTPAPASLARKNAAGEAAISAVMPSADRIRKAKDWVRIASTPTIARQNPRVMPLLMQFTAFGPGVVTNTTQNRAKTVQA